MEISKIKLEEEDLVHKEEMTDDRGLFIFFLLAILVFVVEGDTIYVLNQGKITLEMTVLIHFAVTAFIALIVRYQFHIGGDLRLPMLLLVMTFVCGVFGAGLFMVTTLFYVVYRRFSMDFAQWFSTLFPTEEIEETEELYDRIIYGLDDVSQEEVEPFYNIVVYGTLKQKQLVLAKITRYFQPRFAPSLLRAIDDPDNAVRVQAATSIAKIEQKFMDNFVRLEKSIEKDPDNVKNLMIFAGLCDDYAHSGILDPDREQQTRNKAISIYQHCLELVSNEKDQAIRLALGRLFVRNKEPEKCYQTLKVCFDRGDNVPPNIVAWYLESLFHMRRYDEIRVLAREHASKIDEGKPQAKMVLDTLKLWGRGVGEEFLETHKNIVNG